MMAAALLPPPIRFLYPQPLPSLSKDVTVGDYFERETVNPANYIALYGVDESNAGTISIASARNLSLVTDANANDHANVRTAEWKCARRPDITTSPIGVAG